VKTLLFEPINERCSIPTNTDVLQALLVKDLKVLMACGGKGICATCHVKVLGDGVVVEVPEGMYVERVEDLMSLLGKRAEKNILHPINGAVLIAKGKIITRSRLEELKYLNVEVSKLRDAAQ
jgi:ferredoxin